MMILSNLAVDRLAAMGTRNRLEEETNDKQRIIIRIICRFLFYPVTLVLHEGSRHVSPNVRIDLFRCTTCVVINTALPSAEYYPR